MVQCIRTLMMYSKLDVVQPEMHSEKNVLARGKIVKSVRDLILKKKKFFCCYLLCPMDEMSIMSDPYF